MTIGLNPNLSHNVKLYFLDTFAMSDDTTDPETLFNRPPLTHVECYEVNKEVCRLTGTNILALATVQTVVHDYNYYSNVDDNTYGLRLVVDHPTIFLKETLEDFFANNIFKNIVEIHDVEASVDTPRQLHIEFTFEDHNSDIGRLVTLFQQSLDQPFFVDSRDAEEFDTEYGNNYQAFLSEQLEQQASGE